MHATTLHAATMHVVLGGSFDPVHEGHLHTAAALRERLGIPGLTLLPAARSPLKPAGTPDRHRLAMLQLAVQDFPGLLVDDRELRRPPPSYTIDTLRELRSELGTTSPLVWVLGADTLADLSRWKDWQQLTALAHLLVVERPGARWPATGPVAEWLATLPAAASADQLQCRPSGALMRIALPPQPFSSTALRMALAQRSPDTAKPAGLPEGVWRYITEHHLYLSGCGQEAS